MNKVQPSKPLFIMLFGLPGSGKTFFARQFCERVQAAHIQADRIRAELFEQPRYDKQENDVVAQLTHYMVGEFLQAGVSVVYDMNAMRMSQRRALRDLARKAHATPVLVWLQIDADSAFQRLGRRDRRRADDKYAAPVDRATFQRIAANVQHPDTQEDYVVISGKHVFNMQYNTVMKRLHDLNLVKGEETTTHVVKPGLVNLVPATPVQQQAVPVQNPVTPATPPQQRGRVSLQRRNIIIH